jgi:sarcosine oxidase subunit alpha
MSQPFRLAGGGSIDRSRPLRFTFDGLDLSGLARRHAGLRAARQWRASGRALVQISPAARHAVAGAEEPNALVTLDAGRRPRHAQSARDPDRALRRLIAPRARTLAVARIRRGADQRPVLAAFSAPASTTRPSWAEGRLGGALRADDPPRRGLGRAPREPDPDRYRAIRPLRRAGRRRGAGRARGGAGRERAAARASSCATNRPNSAARCSPRRGDDRRRAARRGSRRRSPLAPRPRALLTRTQAFGYYAQNFVAGQRAPHRPSRRIPIPTAARAAVAGARQEVVLATGAHRAPAGLSGQRPAGRHARRCRAHAIAARYGAKVGERVVVATAHDSAYRAALDLQAAGVEIARSPICARGEGPLPQAARARAEPARRDRRRSRRRRRPAGQACARAKRRGTERGQERTVACDALLMSGGWTPRCISSRNRAASSCSTRRCSFQAGRSARAALAGACNAAYFDLASVLADGRGGRRRGGGFTARARAARV